MCSALEGRSLRHLTWFECSRFEGDDADGPELHEQLHFSAGHHPADPAGERVICSEDLQLHPHHYMSTKHVQKCDVSYEFCTFSL